MRLPMFYRESIGLSILLAIHPFVLMALYFHANPEKLTAIATITAHNSRIMVAATPQVDVIKGVIKEASARMPASE
ncbi:MAG: hypothetical protein AB7O96_01200 [Pseudobdellovibrionaceae bacterium]